MIDRSWLIHESPGLIPDWLGDIKLFSLNNSYSLLSLLIQSKFGKTGTTKTPSTDTFHAVI